MAPSPLKYVYIFQPEATPTFTMERVCRAHWRAPAVKNLNVCFCGSETHHGHQQLELIRHCWWKSVLPQNTLLNLWPLILEKADSWNKATSHRPLYSIFLDEEKVLRAVAEYAKVAYSKAQAVA